MHTNTWSCQKSRYPKASKQMKWHLPLLAMREMQIKTARYHYKPTGLVENDMKM